jgi:hypothetical protein
MLSLEHLKMVHDFIFTCKYGPWRCADAMLQKPKRVAMQAILEKDFSPRGSQRNVVARVSRIWVNKDRELYEMGFIVVHQQVPSKH